MRENTDIRTERLRRFWSKNRLAKEAGLDWATVDDAEDGSRETREITLARIKDAFDRNPVDELQEVAS